MLLIGLIIMVYIGNYLNIIADHRKTLINKGSAFAMGQACPDLAQIGPIWASRFFANIAVNDLHLSCSLSP